METGGKVRALAGAAIVVMLMPGAASGATFTAGCTGAVGDDASLIAAIGSANASAGPDTVALGSGCTYTLPAVNNNWYGPNGLPPIASDITIEGNGSTIARASSAPPFRLFFVGADALSAATNGYVSPGPGVLTLRNVTLAGGLAKGGDSETGGGGAGMGGAIFSQGVVVVDHSTIVDNTAQGGASGTGVGGSGGGGIGTNSAGGTGGGFGSGGSGGFGGGTGGGSNSGGGGGGAGFRVSENGVGANMTTGAPGPGGGPLTGTGGFGGANSSKTGAAGGDGSGGGGSGTGADGGAFGAGGPTPVTGGGSAGGGVGGGGSGFANTDAGGGGGGFGGGGGAGSSTATGGSGGFGGGGGYGPAGGGGAGFGGGTATTTGGGGGGAGLGGAIFSMQGQLTVVNSTLTANSALGGSDNVPDHAKGIGGAVFNLNGTFTATASTFFANTATYNGASIYNLVYDGATARTAQATLVDTIVADGQVAADLASDKPLTTQGPPNLGTAAADLSRFDLVRSALPLGGGSITGSALTADPLLGPLQSNGGPTQTMAPAAASPVIDAGGNCPATDQRGQPRPDNGESACDIGAYEVQDPAGGGGGGGGGGSRVAVISGERLSPAVFAAAPSGPSALAARRRRFGTKVTYSLNLDASVRFAVVKPLFGRRGKGSRCVKATRRNRRARRCTILVGVRGSFTLPARGGINSFRFTGRVGGRQLRPGSYRLIATPLLATGAPGHPAIAAFRIVK